MHAEARSGVAGRWIAAAMLLVVVLIVGIFLWSVIRPPPPPAEAAPGALMAGERRIAGPNGAWVLSAKGLPRADRTVAVTVSAKRLDGRPLAGSATPMAVLHMAGMAMDERLELTEEAPGVWRGTGRASMAGNWSLVVVLNGETLSVPFRALGF